jgi:Cu(I)/Ag(I) efflux system membrane fusion protein
MKNLITKKSILITALVVIAFFLGTFFNTGGGKQEESHQHEEGQEQTQSQTWTCSMHPQIKLPKPGKCPICFMDLIPLEDGGDDEGERQLSMSPASKKLAEIETSPVMRKSVHTEVRMVGKVDFDETRVKVITSRFAGRLDKLYVDYTGVSLKKGAPLASIYSPELYAAQEEFLQAYRAAGSSSAPQASVIDRTAQATVEAARERLSQWGLTREQIKEIETSSKPDDHLTIFAPIAGVAIHKFAVEGMYVTTGTRLYTIADLSRVWVMLDAYESDLAWLRLGQQVDFTAEAFPGETFQGKIGFIDPVLNPSTRTVKVRLNVNNKNGKLKPDMFVTGIVKAGISSLGKVTQGAAKGKKPPLVIPTTAAMITGKRSVVYIDKGDKDKPVFEGREVVLGPRAGNYYIVKSGLEEGEKVVTRGTFKIDAEMQIQAKPSMMSPEGGAPAPGHDHGDQAENASQKSFRQGSGSDRDRNQKDSRQAGMTGELKAFLGELDGMYAAYFQAQVALANDNQKDAQQALGKVKKAANAVDMKKMKGPAHESWMSILNKLNKDLEHIMHLENINGVREAFRTVSNALIELEKNFGHKGSKKHFVAFCPMAFDNKGGSWLQTEKTINNPYYGAAMLRCGEIKEEISPR